MLLLHHTLCNFHLRIFHIKYVSNLKAGYNQC